VKNADYQVGFAYANGARKQQTPAWPSSGNRAGAARTSN
jgi:hypothetical protein